MSDELRKKQKNKIFLKKPIDGIRKTLMVSSAKGGVGKSTVAINLACAFKKIGLTVGYLDADIYGPSLPKLINNKKKPDTNNGKLIRCPVDDIRIASRSTQGVKIFDVDDQEQVVSVERLGDLESDDDDGAGDE